MTIELNDGRTLTRHIEHAIGSLEKPMSDSDLEHKFSDLADGILSAERTKKLIELCWTVEVPQRRRDRASWRRACSIAESGPSAGDAAS